MSKIELNRKLFNSRLQSLLDAWNNANPNDEYSSLHGIDVILLKTGDPSPDEEPMNKSTALQQWLLGYEFPSTFILFEKDLVTFACSSKKVKILQQLQNDAPVPIEMLALANSKEPPNDSLPKLLERYTRHTRAGVLTKDTASGKIVAGWQKLLSSAGQVPEQVDIALAVSSLLAVKDAEELANMRLACALTSTLLVHHAAMKLEMILDKEAEISHYNFASQIEGRLGSDEGSSGKGPDMRVWGKNKDARNVDFGLVDMAYPPIIISKSSPAYDVKVNATSSDDNIAHKGVLLVAFGLRYKSYASNLARTFIVDPENNQEAQYNLLLSLQSELLNYMKDGAVAREVYQHAVDFIKEKDASLERHFTRNIGFAMGLEFRDSNFMLSAKNNRKLKENMVFNLALAFIDLTDKSGKPYALQLADTVAVQSGKSVLLTQGCKTAKDTLFFLNPPDGDPKKTNGEKEKKPPVLPKANGSPAKSKTVGGKMLRNQRRAVQDEVHQSAMARLIEHQRELHEKIQQEGVARYAGGGGGKSGKEGKGWKQFQSYKGEGALPSEVERLKIFIDRKAQTVILPIYGFAVPFHINTIKNASKNDEGKFTYLRLNFQTPGQLTGKKEDTPFEDPDATFIRSISYRSSDGNHIENIYKQITDLKRDANKREQNRKNMADVIDQDNLVELKGRRPIRMAEAFIRPALDGKRLPGEVQIHQSGVRYQHPTGQKVDILFNNVKHLFFQPCDHELLVIVHFHLKAPIMIGKKKASDVQFFREATDVQFDETGNRKRKHRYGDDDEIEMEQQERKRRLMLNKEIKAFAEKVAEAASMGGDNLELDIPFRELSFEGVPFRSGVRLQPTTECLVHLTDPPFLVVTLADIEIASLERVQYGLKHFDLCFIFKDYSKPPLHINSISSTQMDDVKNWLDSVDIPMSEGPVNLNWGPIMKHINEDPHEFFVQGGWSFLGGSQGGADESSEEGSGSESEFSLDEASDADEPSEDSESYSDASASAESGSDFGEGSSDDSGDDWDELERKAARADKARAEGRKDDSDDDRPKKKANGKANGKSNGKSNGKKR
ncbi:FACT complex subunit SPT16 [Fistulina hepatica ATCC 64428]|nr:FACT complex subunit SPT16 [Fistulina hepatica ATCC 64428]